MKIYEVVETKPTNIQNSCNQTLKPKRQRTKVVDIENCYDQTIKS